MSEQNANKEKRKILMYVLVPLGAVLLIALGALALRGAIRADQARTDSEVVKSPVVLEQAKAMPAYAEVTSYTGELPEGCRVVTVPGWHSMVHGLEIFPPENALSAEEAAAIGVWNIQLALGVTVTGDVFVQYGEDDLSVYGIDGIIRGYRIYAGGEGDLTASYEDGLADAPYSCGIDAITGEMNSVQRESMQSEMEREKYYDAERIRATEELYASAGDIRNNPMATERAIEFVTEKYLRENQSIVITFIEGFTNGGAGHSPLVFDCYIIVEPGSSYLLRMGYPGFGVESVSVFSEEEAANRLSFDVEFLKLIQGMREPMDASMSDEEILSLVKEKIQTGGVFWELHNPEDPHVFIDKHGYIVYIDLATGDKMNNITVDRTFEEFQRAFKMEEFRSLFRSYEEYMEENFWHLNEQP